MRGCWWLGLPGKGATGAGEASSLILQKKKAGSRRHAATRQLEGSTVGIPRPGTLRQLSFWGVASSQACGQLPGSYRAATYAEVLLGSQAWYLRQLSFCGLVHAPFGW